MSLAKHAAVHSGAAGMAGQLGMRWRYRRPPKHQLRMLIPRELWEEIKEASARQGVTASSYLRNLITGNARSSDG
jgi:hypothetical protein